MSMNKKRILIVDDDEMQLRKYQSILKEEGYLVETALNGTQALEKFSENVFHMVVLDIKLPDIMGDEVAREIRKRDDKVLMVMITGYPTLQKGIDALELGILDILVKPVAVDELLDVIREAHYL